MGILMSMRSFYLLSGLLVEFGKLESLLPFSKLLVCVDVIVLGECVIVFQSETLSHESNVQPSHMP